MFSIKKRLSLGLEGWDKILKKAHSKDRSLIPAERIERLILLIRGHKVMLDSDLAELYGVTTKRLNEQVRRNLSRFPEDFMFQLTESETHLLRSQIATSKERRGGRRYHGGIWTAIT
jgi:ORF6N domain